MAMSLMEDEPRSWLARTDSSSENEPEPEPEYQIHGRRPNGMPARIDGSSGPIPPQFLPRRLGGERPESYRRVIARNRENVHNHTDSNVRLGAALSNLQIWDQGDSNNNTRGHYSPNNGSPVLGNEYQHVRSTSGSQRNYSTSNGNNAPIAQPIAQPKPQPVPVKRGIGALPVLAQKLGLGSRSESLPPTTRRPTAPALGIETQSSSSRKQSAPVDPSSALNLPGGRDRSFGTLLKSPTKANAPTQPKRRTQFNPEGTEVDEQRWRFHRDQLFQCMERAEWAEATEHSDALSVISKEYGSVLSMNERYFFEKINGILLVAQRKSSQAIKLADKSNAELSNTLQLVKCIALMQLGDFGAAREACQPLFKIWSRDDVLKDQRTHYYLMAMILDRLGKKAEAKWYRQHIPDNFRFDLWIESALYGLQLDDTDNLGLGHLLTTELPRAPSPSLRNAPATPLSTTSSEPPPFTPSDPAPPEYTFIPPAPVRYTARDALETLIGFGIGYEQGEVRGEDIAKRRAIMFFLSEYRGDKMYDCVRALLADANCRGVIQVAENHSMSNSLGLLARNKGPAAGEMARFLLSCGDQPYTLDSSPEGFSPLHVAAKEENFAVAEAILNYMSIPADMDVLSRNNLTPLHLAAEYNKKTLIVSLLLDSGADVNMRGGPLGNTPLHFAIRGYLHDPRASRLETIDYLLESPYIKLGQKNNNKETPEEYAKLCTLSDLAQRIKDMRKNGKAIFRSRH